MAKVAAQTQEELEAQVLGIGGASPTSSSEADSSANEAESTSEVSTEALKDDLEELKIEEKKKETVRESDLKSIEDAVAGPKAIPSRHILVVQRRYIQKDGRHEIIPAMIGLQPADSFRKQLQWGFGYVYHLTETVALEVLHANVITNYSTGLANQIRDPATVNLEVDRVEPVLSLGSTIQWTPFHSKAGALRSIHFFEGFLMAGGGMSKFENQNASMAMAGLGFRVFLTKNAIFKAEIRDYIEFKKSGTDYRFNFLAGFGILLGDLK